MALPFDLGRGAFRILDSNLTLTLHASAEIQLDSETIDSRDPEFLKQLLRNRQIWLTQAPETKLHICLSVEPDLAHPASTFFSQAGEILRISKIWSDLGLGVLFRGYNYDFATNDPKGLRLLFGLRKLASRSAAPKVFRLPATLQSFPEAVPPAGIPTASLRSVAVVLDYSSNHEIVKYKTEQLHATPMTESEDNVQRHFPITPPSSQSRYLQEAKNPETSFDEDAGIKFDEDVLETNEGWFLFQYSHSYKDSPQWNQANVPCTQDFSKLLDMGVRSLITPEPTRVDKTIQKDNEEQTHLSKLAPTIFSIGYSEAMNQRSRFISSIAKSLALIIERSKNPALREKTSALKSTQYQPGVQSKQVTLRTAIKSSLWRIAQKQLYNPNASRSLSALDSTSASRDEPLIGDISDLEGDCDNEEDYLLTDEEELVFSDEESDDCPHSDDILDFDNPGLHHFDNLQNHVSNIGNNKPSSNNEPISSPCLLPTSPIPCSPGCQNSFSDSEMLTDTFHDMPGQTDHGTINEDYVSGDALDMIWD